MIFSNPLYLTGLLLSILPIIIHLWFRRRLKKIPFSSLDFLKKTEAHRFGWLRIRDLLILTLRCLMIAFLFASLAEPIIPGRFFFTDRLASLVLILDNSFSMDYAGNFADAKATALKLIDRYSPRSEFIILPLCGPEHDSMPYWQNRSQAKSEIEDITITYDRGNLIETLNLMRLPEKRHALEYIYIGDCQEANFIGKPDHSPDKTMFYAVKIPSGGNCAVIGVDLTDPVAIPGNEFSLHVVVKNFSTHKWSGVINIRAGSYQEEKEINIAAQSEHDFDLILPVRETRGFISLYDDSLVRDNTRFFVKQIPRQIKILVVNPNPYLEAALQNPKSNGGPFLTDFVSALSSRDLRKYDALILNGVSEINAGEKLRLQDYLADTTRGLVCFLGDLVGDNLSDIIAPCRAEKYVTPQGYVTLDWIDIQHPVFNIFKTTGAIRNVKFYRFQQLNNKGRIIARLDNTYPLIVQLKNIYVIAAEFDPLNTDIMYKSSFIPLLLRIVTACGNPIIKREFLVGDKSITALTDPNGLNLPQGSTLTMPGFYRDGDNSIALNVDPVESNLKVIGPEQAAALNISLTDDQEFFRGTELSDLLLILALIALLLEAGLLLFR